MNIFGLNHPNFVTNQDKIDAFMDTIWNSVYTEEFEDQDKENFDKKFYLEASSTFPLVVNKWKINMTLYNVHSAMTNYFNHHGDTVYSWCNDGFCKPVDQSCIFFLHGSHYQ